MRVHRRHWLVLVLLSGSCFARCEHSMPTDQGVPAPLDFAVGELGRPAGNACTTVDNCNRVVADTCAGHCQCGSEHPCDGELTCCNGRCVDALTDPQNCGGCGIGCATGQCVHADGGAPHCTCADDADAGSDCSAASPFEPTCNGEGLCTCGASSVGVCNSLNADSCTAGGCRCGADPACSGQLVDHCNPGHGCQCGSSPACDPALATFCDPTRPDNPCRCALGPACQPGTFCCTQNSTCCQPSQYCCLNGCCDHPCLLFGFCDH